MSNTRTKQVRVTQSTITTQDKTVTTPHDALLVNRDLEDNVVLIGTQQHRTIRSGPKGIGDMVKGADIKIPVGGYHHTGRPTEFIHLPPDVGPNSKTMFVMQALRKVIMNQESKWTVLICSEGYTENQLKTIESLFKKLTYQGKPVINEVFRIPKNPRAILDYINNLEINGQQVFKDKVKGREEFKIKRFYIYSHGIVGAFQLWMKLFNAGEQFDVSHAKEINHKAFDPEARIVSMACRTGLGNPDVDESVFYEEYVSTGFWGSEKVKRRRDEKPDESLAQYLADHSGAQVNAYLCRTDYEDTLNTPDELDFLDACDAYREQIKPKRPKNKENGAYARIVKKGLTSQDKKRFDELHHVRKHRFYIDDAWFDPFGALHPVKAGTTPEGVSQDLKTFVRRTKKV